MVTRVIVNDIAWDSDPVVQWVRGLDGKVDYSVERISGARRFSGEDRILLFECLSGFLARRFELFPESGKCGFICAASFNYEDLHDFFYSGVTVEQSGIDKLITNLGTTTQWGLRIFVERMLRPVVPVVKAEESSLFGTVVDRVENRDWSWVDLAVSCLGDKADLAYKILVQDAHSVLPESLQRFRSSKKSLDCVNYLAAPNVLDYRVGIVPSEYLWARHSNSQVWLPKSAHKGLAEWDFTRFESVRSFCSALREGSSRGIVPVEEGAGWVYGSSWQELVQAASE